MSNNFNTDIWQQNDTFQALLDKVSSYNSIELNNILQTAIPSFLLALHQSLPNHNIIYLTNKSRSDFYKQLHEIERLDSSDSSKQNIISHYFNNTFLEDTDKQKLSSLTNICNNLLHQKNNFYLFNNNILLEPLPRPELFKEYTLITKNNYNFQELLDTLVTMGYTRVDNVLEQGQFALRGDILDIYPASTIDNLPYRITFFDEELESIHSFDLQTQRTIPHKQHTQIVVNDYLLFNSLFDYAQLENKLLKYTEELNTAEQAFWLEDINNNNWQRFIPWVLELESFSNILEYINSKNTVIVTDSYNSIEQELQSIVDNQLNKLTQAKDKLNIPPTQHTYLQEYLVKLINKLEILNNLTVLQINL